MTYFLPQKLDDALELIQDGSAKLVAGGTDFYPAMQKGQAMGRIVDLSRLGDMQGVTKDGDGWRIGGATTWTELIAAPLPPAFDGLKQAACTIGSVQIQNAATLAGNLCNASPAADGVPALLTLDASVELASVRGRRILPLGEFITGVRQTRIAADEILSAILVPALPDHAVGRFEKLGSRRYLVISITMVAAVIGVGPDGLINFARLAVGACSAVAKRQPALEAALIGQRPQTVEVTPDDLTGLSPITDMRGDAEFRLIAAARQSTRAIQNRERS